MVFLGGGLGAIMRYGIGSFTRWIFPQAAFPLGTLLANILSCILFVLFYLLVVHRTHSLNLQLLLIVGLCGGFSTFSTFAFENFELIRAGHWGIALLNILLSVAVCVLVFVWFLWKKP